MSGVSVGASLGVRKKFHLSQSASSPRVCASAAVAETTALHPTAVSSVESGELQIVMEKLYFPEKKEEKFVIEGLIPRIIGTKGAALSKLEEQAHVNIIYRGQQYYQHHQQQMHKNHTENNIPHFIISGENTKRVNRGKRLLLESINALKRSQVHQHHRRPNTKSKQQSKNISSSSSTLRPSLHARQLTSQSRPYGDPSKKCAKSKAVKRKRISQEVECGHEVIEILDDEEEEEEEQEQEKEINVHEKRNAGHDSTTNPKKKCKTMDFPQGSIIPTPTPAPPSTASTRQMRKKDKKSNPYDMYTYLQKGVTRSRYYKLKKRKIEARVMGLKSLYRKQSMKLAQMRCLDSFAEYALQHQCCFMANNTFLSCHQKTLRLKQLDLDFEQSFQEILRSRKKSNPFHHLTQRLKDVLSCTKAKNHFKLIGYENSENGTKLLNSSQSYTASGEDIGSDSTETEDDISDHEENSGSTRLSENLKKMISQSDWQNGIRSLFNLSDLLNTSYLHSDWLLLSHLIKKKDHDNDYTFLRDCSQYCSNFAAKDLPEIQHLCEQLQFCLYKMDEIVIGESVHYFQRYQTNPQQVSIHLSVDEKPYKENFEQLKGKNSELKMIDVTSFHKEICENKQMAEIMKLTNIIDPEYQERVVGQWQSNMDYSRYLKCNVSEVQEEIIVLMRNISDNLNRFESISLSCSPEHIPFKKIITSLQPKKRKKKEEQQLFFCGQLEQLILSANVVKRKVLHLHHCFLQLVGYEWAKLVENWHQSVLNKHSIVLNLIEENIPTTKPKFELIQNVSTQTIPPPKTVSIGTSTSERETKDIGTNTQTRRLICHDSFSESFLPSPTKEMGTNTSDSCVIFSKEKYALGQNIMASLHESVLDKVKKPASCFNSLREWFQLAPLVDCNEPLRDLQFEMKEMKSRVEDYTKIKNKSVEKSLQETALELVQVLKKICQPNDDESKFDNKNIGIKATQEKKNVVLKKAKRINSSTNKRVVNSSKISSSSGAKTREELKLELNQLQNKLQMVTTRRKEEEENEKKKSKDELSKRKKRKRRTTGSNEAPSHCNKSLLAEKADKIASAIVEISSLLLERRVADDEYTVTVEKENKLSNIGIMTPAATTEKKREPILIDLDQEEGLDDVPVIVGRVTRHQSHRKRSLIQEQAHRKRTRSDSRANTTTTTPLIPFCSDCCDSNQWCTTCRSCSKHCKCSNCDCRSCNRISCCKNLLQSMVGTIVEEATAQVEQIKFQGECKRLHKIEKQNQKKIHDRKVDEDRKNKQLLKPKRKVERESQEQSNHHLPSSSPNLSPNNNNNTIGCCCNISVVNKKKVECKRSQYCLNCKSCHSHCSCSSTGTSTTTSRGAATRTSPIITPLVPGCNSKVLKPASTNTTTANPKFVPKNDPRNKERFHNAINVDVNVSSSKSNKGSSSHHSHHSTSHQSYSPAGIAPGTRGGFNSKVSGSVSSSRSEQEDLFRAARARLKMRQKMAAAVSSSTSAGSSSVTSPNKKKKIVGTNARQIVKIWKRTADPYLVLGLPHSASTSIIKRRYRQLALQLHPDKNKSSNGSIDPLSNMSNSSSVETCAFVAITDAYRLLMTSNP